MALTDPISEPQISYIKGLLEKKDISSLPDAQREFLDPTGETYPGQREETLDANLRLMNKGQASACIKALLACKFKAVDVAPPVVESPKIGEITGEPDVSDEPVEEEQTVIEVPIDDSEPAEVAPVQGLGTKAPDV